jgi:hypothetical protein
MPQETCSNCGRWWHLNLKQLLYRQEYRHQRRCCVTGSTNDGNHDSNDGLNELHKLATLPISKKDGIWLSVGHRFLLWHILATHRNEKELQHSARSIWYNCLNRDKWVYYVASNYIFMWISVLSSETIYITVIERKLQILSQDSTLN